MQHIRLDFLGFYSARSRAEEKIKLYLNMAEALKEFK